MSDIRDIYFTNWYEEKDFTVLEQMKSEFHREYYCRTAWFQRDEEVDKLHEENEKLNIKIDKMLKYIEEYWVDKKMIDRMLKETK